MPNRSARYVTIAIIPHGSQAPRTVCLPATAVRAIPVLAGAVLGALIWSSGAYLDAREHLGYLARRLELQQQAYGDLEGAYLDGQSLYESLTRRAMAIEGRLDELASESAELRRMLAQADQVPPPRPAARPPASGSDPSVGRGGPSGPVDVFRVVTGTLRYADEQLRLYDDHLRALRVSTLEFVRRRAHTPSIWPADGWLSSGFGTRRHPVTGRPDFHQGVDIAGMTGTPVLVAADGVVAMARRWGSYGLTIVVDHGYGLRTVYAHLSRMLVKPGQRVTKGQVIGRMGSTGLSTGPHLHYEVHLNGQPVNPLRYLP